MTGGKKLFVALAVAIPVLAIGGGVAMANPGALTDSPGNTIQLSGEALVPLTSENAAQYGFRICDGACGDCDQECDGICDGDCNGNCADCPGAGECNGAGNCTGERSGPGNCAGSGDCLGAGNCAGSGDCVAAGNCAGSSQYDKTAVKRSGGCASRCR